MPAFRIVINLSPVWEKMAREFSGTSERLLQESFNRFARSLGERMQRGIQASLTPHRYTERLSRSWVATYRPGPPSSHFPTSQIMTILEYRPAGEVPANIGRPVLHYAGAIEYGSQPHHRPWGRLSRQRLEAWAEARLGDRRRARFVMASIYRYGTPAYPYFKPSLDEMIAVAEDYAETELEYWAEEIAAEMIT